MCRSLLLIPSLALGIAACGSEPPAPVATDAPPPLSVRADEPTRLVHLDDAQVTELAVQTVRVAESTEPVVLRYRSATGPQADTLVARSQEGYLLGEVPLFALLDAQRTALAAEERYAAALRDYTHRPVELERFTGRSLAFPEVAPFAPNDQSMSP